MANAFLEKTFDKHSAFQPCVRFENDLKKICVTIRRRFPYFIQSCPSVGLQDCKPFPIYRLVQRTRPF